MSPPLPLVRRRGDAVELVAGDGVVIRMTYEQASVVGAKLSHEAMLAASTALGNITVGDVAVRAARWLRRNYGGRRRG